MVAEPAAAGVAPARGRPRAVSREMLQEAAFECFLEDGYAATTVERIATRAGVGRSTFFGYFSGKSDVFWIELDDALAAVRRAAKALPPGSPAVEAAAQCLLAGAEELGSRVPWPLTQHELIGADAELRASAAGIVTEQTALLAGVVARRLPPGSAEHAPIVAGALVGAAVAALAVWAAAGPGRGPLAPRVEAALAPVRAGLSAA